MNSVGDRRHDPEAVCTICGSRVHSVEEHHVAGKTNRPDVTVTTGTPDHRVLTGLQYDTGIPLKHDVARSEGCVTASSMLGFTQLLGLTLESHCECLAGKANELRGLGRAGVILIDVIHQHEHRSPVEGPYPVPNPVGNDRYRAVQQRLETTGQGRTCAAGANGPTAETEAEQTRRLLEVFGDLFAGLPGAEQPIAGHDNPFEVISEQAPTFVERWGAIEKAGLASVVGRRLDGMQPAMAAFSAGLRRARTDEELVAVVLQAFPLGAQIRLASELFMSLVATDSDEEAVAAARRFLASS